MGALLALGASVPLQALASIPQPEPLKMRDMTSQEKHTFNDDLRADFKALSADLKAQFAELLQKTSLMGFYKGDRVESSLSQTTR